MKAAALLSTELVCPVYCSFMVSRRNPPSNRNPEAVMPVSLLLGDIDGTTISKASIALKKFGLKTEDLESLKAKAEQMGKKRMSLESLYATTLSSQETLNYKKTLEEKVISQNNENNPKLSKDQLLNKDTTNLDEGKQASQNSIVERVDIIPNLGDYYALIIGNNDYMNL